MLARGLASLAELELPNDVEVTLIVSDNDKDRSASDVFELQTKNLKFHAIYLVEEKQGIVPNRNRVLQQSMEIGAKYLAFFDDDETVHSKWLISLLDTVSQYKVQAVWGKTIYSIPPNAAPWLHKQNFFGGEQPPTGTKRRGASTNNVLIDLTFLKKHGLQFDDRFNDIGGSDSFLFRKVRDHGGTVVSCQEAITFEEVPETRATEAWILRRAYKNAHTEYRRASVRKGRLFAGLLVVGYSSWLLICYTATVFLYRKNKYELTVFNRRRKAKIKGFWDALRGGTHQEYNVVHGG